MPEHVKTPEKDNEEDKEDLQSEQEIKIAAPPDTKSGEEKEADQTKELLEMI